MTKTEKYIHKFCLVFVSFWPKGSIPKFVQKRQECLCSDSIKCPLVLGSQPLDIILDFIKVSPTTDAARCAWLINSQTKRSLFQLTVPVHTIELNPEGSSLLDDTDENDTDVLKTLHCTECSEDTWMSIQSVAGKWDWESQLMDRTFIWLL